MNRYVRTGIASAVLMAASVSGAGGAAAAEPDDVRVENVSGIQPLPPGYSRLADTPEALAAKPLTDAMVELRTLYVQRYGLDGSSMQRMQSENLDAEIKLAQAKVERLSGQPIEDFLPVPPSAGTVSKVAGATAALSTSKTLRFVHSKQSKSYWCGPASTAMVIRATMPASTSETSRYNSSHTMSQTRLASSTYLATTTSGTYMPNIARAVNRWTGLTSYTTYYSPSVTTLRNVVTSSIGGYTRGVAYGTHETKGGTHYNYHPKTYSIDHFVAGYGYSSSGNTLKYGDPASGSPALSAAWGDVKKTGSMSASSMASYIHQWGVVA